MRFELNQQVLFINVDYEATSPRFGALYHPWEDKLNAVTIGSFTCVEHHKVPGEWDDEVKYDGYVFHDKDGKRWNNQYPRASYGQLDDSNNWRIWPTEESDRQPDKLYYMTTLDSYLENVLRGVRDMKKRLDNVNEGKPDRHGDSPEWLQKVIDSLLNHYKEIDQKLRNELQLKAVNVGWTAKFTDGRPDEHIPSIPDVKFFPLDQETTHIEY